MHDFNARGFDMLPCHRAEGSQIWRQLHEASHCNDGSEYDTSDMGSITSQDKAECERIGQALHDSFKNKDNKMREAFLEWDEDFGELC